MWKTVKLGDVLKTGAGGTPLKSKNEFYEDGNISWLLSGAVSEKEISKSKTFITEAGLNNSSAKIFPPNTVLVAMYGATAGQVGILRFPSATNQAVCGIYPNESYLPEFLYYFLENYKERLLLETSGVAQPNLSQVKIKNIQIPILSTSEQQCIVAKLDSAFAEIDKALLVNQNNIENSKRLYSNGIDETFKTLSSKNAELGKYSNINYGYTTKASFAKGTYKLLRITDLQDNSVNWDAVPYCEIEKRKLDKMLLYDGDIVFARTGATTGKSFLVKNPVNALFASYLIRVSVDREVFDPTYVMHFFQSTKYWQQVNSGISGSAQGGFNASKLSKLEIPIINKNDQQEIVQKLDFLLEETNQLTRIYEEKLDQYNFLKSAVLKKELQT